MPDPGDRLKTASAAELDWEDSLCDLISRMDDAEIRLVDMALTHKPNSTEAIRLDAKANGVRLASGYVSEELRRIRTARREQSHA